MRPLIPARKFNIDRIMVLVAASSKSKTVTVDKGCRRQLRFWDLEVLACNGRLSIPDADTRLPAWALDIFTDAVGCTLDNPGRGSGCVCGADWFYIPWSARVNGGSWKVDGKKVGRKLSALELMGPLAAIRVFAERCWLRPVRIWVDIASSLGYGTRDIAIFVGCAPQS